MEGAICKRDILAHPIVTIRSFGWRVFVRALLAGPEVTFLALLMDTGALQPAVGGFPALIDRCVNLERVAMRIYRTLANRFETLPAAHEFFINLANQERGHADLLELVSMEADRMGENGGGFNPFWEDAISRAERHLSEIEVSLAAIERLEDALQTVIRAESSEINKIFAGLVATSESDFVRAVDVFRMAGEMHLAYIRERIPEIAPSLAPACEELVL